MGVESKKGPNPAEIRKIMGMPVWEYMQTTYALAGSGKTKKNISGLNDMGENGWEIIPEKKRAQQILKQQDMIAKGKHIFNRSIVVAIPKAVGPSR